MSQLFPGVNDKLLQKKMMALAKKQGMKLPKIPKKHKIKEHRMEPGMAGMMRQEKKKNPVGRPPKNPMMPSKYMLAKQQQQAQFQGQPSFPGQDMQLPPFLPGGQNLLPNPVSFASQMTASSSLTPPKFTQPPLGTPQPPLIEGKLISEPDRNKLNIFKKIQGKQKEDLSQKQFHAPLDFSSPQKFDRPELEIFRTNQQPGFDFSMTKIPKKSKPPKVQEEMPLNMSMARPADNQFSIDDLSIPKTPNFPRTPELKMEKKKKEKKKEKKMRHEFMGGFGGGFQDQSNPFLQKPPENPAALLAGTGLTQAQQNLLFPFGTLGNLGNLMFPSGPGLIPNPGLIPTFPPMGPGVPPFPMMMPGQDLNLQKFQKPPKKQEKKDFGNLLPDKSFCNVAPLVPPSLSLEPSQPRFDLPVGAEKLPSATQITPIKSVPPMVAPSSSQKPERVETFVRQEETVTTYDLTSSPEPMEPPKPKSPAPAVSITPSVIAAPQAPTITPQLLPPAPVSIPSNILQQPDLDIIKIKDKSEKKKDKKDKKDKEGKMKKKKDKKDKNKSKEGKEEKKEKKEKKEKDKERKKEKKEKRKERERERASSVLDSQSQSANDTDTGDNGSTSSVPKLTLKLGASPRPNTPDVYKK